MSHTFRCWIDDGLTALVPPYRVIPNSLPSQDMLYASISAPGENVLAGADAATVPAATDGKTQALKVLGALGAIFVGGVLLKFAFEAAMAHRAGNRAYAGRMEPLPPVRPAWYIPDDELRNYDYDVLKARLLTRGRKGRR